MGEINAKWHKANVLGILKGSAQEKLEKRIKWNVKHSKNCTCRPFPENLKKYL